MTREASLASGVQLVCVKLENLKQGTKTLMVEADLAHCGGEDVDACLTT